MNADSLPQMVRIDCAADCADDWDIRNPCNPCNLKQSAASTCGASTPTRSSCRCPRGIASRWRSTPACASGCCANRASSRPSDLAEAPQAAWDDLRARAHAGVSRGRGGRHAVARGAAAHRLSLVAADGRARPAIGRRDHRREPGRAQRRLRPPTWPAARIMRLPIAARATASSTTSPWRRASLQRDGLATRVAVVDCDVHQGNGTAAIFRGDRGRLHVLDARREELPVQEGGQRPRRRAGRWHRR